ncbi:hypothetical protein ES703_32455 [subsurface metagenome]
MTINEAVEFLTHPVYRVGMVPDPDFINALKLGIEALKSVRTGRKVGLHYEANCLPGETKD